MRRKRDMWELGQMMNRMIRKMIEKIINEKIKATIIWDSLFNYLLISALHPLLVLDFQSQSYYIKYVRSLII